MLIVVFMLLFQAYNGAVEVTGLWNSPDGGQHYIEQAKSQVWWKDSVTGNGETTFAYGEIQDRKITITVVTKIPDYSRVEEKTLELEIISNDRMRVKNMGGETASVEWIRASVAVLEKG